MHHDIHQLRRFYYQRSLGRVVQRILRDRLTGRWSAQSCAGMTVAGFGFAAPMLRPYLPHARRVTALEGLSRATRACGDEPGAGEFWRRN